jgi:cytoskeleton protein RodZ
VQHSVDLKDAPQGEVEASPARTAPATQRYGGIGAELAATRERAGMSIPDLAQKMRIRAEYVEAIESGDFARLPGRIYAVGFIKTYARAMGLDAQLAVDAYKRESASTGTPDKLEFPVPTPARRTPGARLIVGAMASAFAIFGVWQLYGNYAMPKLDRVPPVPAYLLKPSEPLAPPASAPAQVAESVSPAQPMHPDRVAALQQAAPSPVAIEVQPAAVEVPRPLVKPVVPVWALKRAEVTPPPAPAPEAVPDPMETASNDTEDAPPEPPAPIQNAPTEIAATAAAPPRASWTASDAGESAARGFVHGADNFDARIVINAANDSWVEVANKNQDIVFAKLLRAGESYRVPDQGGLVLATGNAGALRVTVDGVPVPTLGAMGAVRRGVVLDPDRLRGAPAQ